MRSGNRPPRTSWLLTRVMEAGNKGITFQELYQLAETHVPGLFRSRTQLREQLHQLDGQGKLRHPGGRYMCAKLFDIEKQKRREAYEAARVERAAQAGRKSRKF